MWLIPSEYGDIISISEMTPGPLAINAATFVGNRVMGPIGSIVATFGFVLPPFIIVLFLSFFYYRYKGLKVVDGALRCMRGTSISLILSASLSLILMSLFPMGISLSGVDWVHFAIFALAFIAMRLFRPNPIVVMLSGDLLGVIGSALL